jgi:hypothetical protein
LTAAREARRLKRDDLHRYENKVVNSGNEQVIWKFVKSRNKKIEEIPVIIHDGVSIYDNSAKATIFNDFICSVFIDGNGQDLAHLPEPNTFLSNVEISPETVNLHVNKLESKMSSGSDGIPQLLLKELAPAITEPLCEIFRTSISSGKLPDEWKVGRVTPIHKKGAKTCVRNFRPITQLCGSSKVLEAMICEKLDEFLESFDKLSSSQYGFRKHRSTVDQLLVSLNDWTKSLDKKN